MVQLYHQKRYYS